MSKITIEITMNEDKSFHNVKKSIKIGNQFDNNVTKIKFNIPDIYNDIAYKYCVLKNPYDFLILKQLDEENSFLVDNTISKFSGTFNLMLVCSNEEILDVTNLNNDNIILTTDYFSATINDNYIEEVSNVKLYCLPKSVYDDLSEDIKVLLNIHEVQ